MPQRSRFEQWPKPQHLACCKFPFPNKTVLTTLKNTNFLAQFTSVGLADRALARVFVRARFLNAWSDFLNLVPRGFDPFGQHQGYEPLGTGLKNR